MAESPLGRIDPRWKIVLAFALSLAIAPSRDLFPGLVIVAYGLLLALLGRLSWRDVIKRVASVNVLLLSLWLTLPFTTEGETLSLGIFSPSVAGLKLALVITLKSTAMVLVLMALFGTSPLHRTLQGMRELGLPSKLVLLLHFCTRYIYVIQDEKRRIQEAAELRGYRPVVSWMGLKAAAFLVVSLLIKSNDRAIRVNEALTLRGFDGSFPSIQEPVGTRPADLVWFWGMSLLFGGCLVL